MTICTESGKLMGLYLSSELYKRIFQVLLDCEEFDTTMRLQGDLTKYNRIFEYPYETKVKFVESTTNYFIEQSIKKPKNPVFPLFLMALYDTLGEDNELRDELEMLHTLVEIELDEITKSQTSPFVQTAPKTASDTKQIANPSPPPIDLMNGVFLDRADRKEIIRILVQLLDAKGNDNEGKKYLLRDCGFSDEIIDTFQLNNASGNIAQTIVGRIETWDKPNAELTYLEDFVSTLVEEAGYIGNAVEKKMKDIITRYSDKRKLYARNIQKSRHLAVLESKDGAIAKQLQEARAVYNRDPAQGSPYKIDISMIIQCNLGTQRKSFTTSFNERFKGFFTFAVACTDRTVLEKYVLGSLLWELQKNNPRPTKVHQVPFYSQSIDNSTADQGSISLQKQIKQFFQGKSLRDVFEDRRDDNLAVVLWPTNPLPYNFKEIALQFSETVKQQVSDIAQNRCFLLFWAKYGPAPIEPLEISGALPAFERFEVDHIFDWWDVSLSYQLKAQNIPEQDIQQWREILVKRVTYHNGYLPWTYDCLLDPLERGGAF